MKKTLILKKLRSNDGASLMVALLFFVVCAVIGSIILTAAMTASGRMTGIKKTNRDLYALKSAAQIFKRDWVIGETNITGGKDDPQVVSPNVNYSSDYEYVKYFLETRGNLAKKVYQNDTPQSMEFVITTTNMPEVKAHVAMDTNFNTEIVFRAVNSETGEEGSGYVTLIIKGTCSDPITIDGVEKVDISWSSPEMYVGGSLQ